MKVKSTLAYQAPKVFLRCSSLEAGKILSTTDHEERGSDPRLADLLGEIRLEPHTVVALEGLRGGGLQVSVGLLAAPGWREPLSGEHGEHLEPDHVHGELLIRLLREDLFLHPPGAGHAHRSSRGHEQDQARAARVAVEGVLEFEEALELHVGRRLGDGPCQSAGTETEDARQDDRGHLPCGATP